MIAQTSIADSDTLRRTMRDLVALSVLPEVWKGYGPVEIAQSLALVVEKLLPVSSVGVRFELLPSDRPTYVIRRKGRLLSAEEADRAALAFEAGLSSPDSQDHRLLGMQRLFYQPIASQAGRCLLFAIGEGDEFPSSEQRAVLSAAASHTATALERHFSRKALNELQERCLISERQWGSSAVQARELTESANRDKDELLANVSHEIRTPMNAILGITELALNSTLTHEQRGWLRTVKLAGEHLLVIVDGLLDFAKAGASKIALEPLEFRLRSELASTIRALAVRAHRKGLELILDIDDSVPDLAVGDAGRLRQVLINLVDNAIKFTSRGEVQVTVHAIPPNSDEVELIFAIRDTGIGIPAHQHAVIFEAFAQADSSTTRRFGGTGLGLTIAAKLTSLMGGRIALESEPDVGSTFTFRVRLARAPGTSQRAVWGASWGGLRALVVDGNPSSRETLVRWLRAWGVEASGVADGLSALQVMMSSAQSSGLQLLLVDGDSPGLPAVTAREQHAAARDLRLIVVGPNKRVTMDQQARRELVVQKPLVKEELHSAISALLAPHVVPPLVSAPVLEQLGPSDRRRVLVAEDNEFNAIVTRELLARRGHDVFVVSNGPEVLVELERAHYDVLVLDVQMPGMDGFDVIQRLRARERRDGGHLPVIALTARARPADRERCLRAGMDDFLAKPINGADLLAAVERLAKGSQGHLAE